MKRIAYLLVVVMLLACLPLTAFAAKAGDEVSITFKAQNLGFAGYAATVNYDSSVLELVDITVSGMGDVNGNSVMVMSLTNITNKNLFTATFKILPAAKAGETYYVTASVTEAYDENVEPVSLSISGGSVKIDECDHNYVKDTAASSDATCGTAGKLVEVCSKCGDTKTTTLDATGKHNHVKDTAASSDATCGAAGKLVEVCSVCGDTKTTTLDATGNHKYEKDESASSDATCGKDGKLVEVCSVCGDTKETVQTATGNHNNGTYTKIDGNDKQHKVSCSVCGMDGDLENHSWDKGTVTTPATCGQPGAKTLTCTKCGYEKTEAIDATGKHTWGKWTEVDKDVHKHECSVCGESEEDEHNWDNGKVTTPATCVPGEKTYTCADCGATKVEAIDADPDKHDRETVKKWNKVDDNYHEGTCACGETIKEKHRWDKKDNGDGTQTWTCKDCKHSLIKGEDDVPDTGDITSQVMMTGAVALVVMMGAVALITKRKTAK